MNQRIEFNKTVEPITKPTNNVPVLRRCGIIALTLMAFVLAQSAHKRLIRRRMESTLEATRQRGKTPFLTSRAGKFNTAVGFFSLRAVTDGKFCTGLGAGALHPCQHRRPKYSHCIWGAFK